MEGLLELFESHKLDLEGIYGKFAEYKSFKEIIVVEYDRWRFTDEAQKEKLKKLLKKRGGKLALDDWITLMQSDGIAADQISMHSGLEIPGTLNYEIAYRQETTAKQPEV